MTVRAVEDILYRIESALGALFFMAMFGAVSVQVFSRYVLNRPLVWPFEFSIYCYVFIIYLGGAMAARRGTHVAFDLVYARLEGRPRAALGALSNLFLCVVFASALPASIEYMKFVGDVRSSALGIPWGVLMAAFPVGMGLIILHLLAGAWLNAREFFAAGGNGEGAG